VALAYSRETYQAVSDPLVNTRYALRAAVRRGILTRAEAAEIVSTVKRFYFPERTRQLVLSTAQKVAGSEQAIKLREFLSTEAPDVKARDARLLLDRIRRDIRGSRTHALAPGAANTQPGASVAGCFPPS
jgi:hypothetical protein